MEKMSDLTTVDIKAVIALEKRNLAVHMVEGKFSEDKLKLLYEELAVRESNKTTEERENGKQE